MPRLKLDVQKSLLLVVDIQTSLTPFIYESDRLLARSEFLIKIASLLDVPILVSEQNPSKMGGTCPPLAQHLGSIYSKMTFSACRCDELANALRASSRTQMVIIGTETHICVSQTAHDLIEEGFEVVVCPDAVSSRTLERHKLGMERIRDAGAIPAHTEAVAYEWLHSAEHPRFREALKIVKEFA